jgi:hypothetical protein
VTLLLLLAAALLTSLGGALRVDARTVLQST